MGACEITRIDRQDTMHFSQERRKGSIRRRQGCGENDIETGLVYTDVVGVA
jgi:hypothetical protein